eukprot:TRINITY_DN36402_c0_g1_i1.p1 TRINITY_DN36402_c0_g1~~TRINITY_DN36402_c0_g1_i1.p1  ORF type:complete len:234 (+),score=32.33 TRINITY_DN36402_c0_g1_i1:165-866(+)
MAYFKNIKNNGHLANSRLLFLAWTGDFEGCESFLNDHIEEIDHVDDFGNSALHISALRGQERILRLLLKRGANPSLVSAKLGQTVLHCSAASSKDDVETLNSILAAGASLEARDNDSRTPLHDAASAGNCRCIKELVVKWGSRLDLKTSSGCTPLYLAAQKGHLDAACLLASLGANINSTCSDTVGQTPILLARAQGWEKQLLENARKPSSPLQPVLLKVCVVILLLFSFFML